MVGGQVVSFVAPTMGAGVSGTPPAAPAAPATTAAPAAPTTAPTTTVPKVSSKELPATGNDVNGLLLMSLAMMLTGGLLLRRTRQI